MPLLNVAKKEEIRLLLMTVTNWAFNLLREYNLFEEKNLFVTRLSVSESESWGAKINKKAQQIFISNNDNNKNTSWQQRASIQKCLNYKHNFDDLACAAVYSAFSDNESLKNCAWNLILFLASPRGSFTFLFIQE